MKYLQTITGREFRITSNRSKRHYTLFDTATGTKYRTFPMTKQEFNSADYWTGNDWKQFLKTDEYTIIKP